MYDILSLILILPNEDTVPRREFNSLTWSVKHVRVCKSSIQIRCYTYMKSWIARRSGDEEQNKVPLGYWRYALPRKIAEYDWRKNGGC
jgi:hypothetical protein